jgi:predicted helicase
MTFPTIDERTTIAAITYFYEPFLEAFDPKLREDLGVWYTPPEIVRHQIRRAQYILKTELKRPRGLIKIARAFSCGAPLWSSRSPP